MDYLALLSTETRARLLAAADRVVLGPGELLMRSGEPGGDVYRLERGTLEIVDTRGEPPVVVNTVAPGTLVGEMAFVDAKVRTADVRAAEESECLAWPREVLLAMAEEDPALGRDLYRALAGIVVARSRFLRTLVEAGAVSGGTGAASQAGSLQAEARALVSAPRTRLMAAEPLARRDEAAARAEIRAAMDAVEAEVRGALAHRSAEDRRVLGQALAHELHPYIIRSHLGELALDRPSGASEEPQALDHLHGGRPEGDGLLGEEIDAWLLARPTAVALRARRAAAAAALDDAVSGAGDAPVLLVNAGRSTLLPQVAAVLAGARAVTLLETSPTDAAAARAALTGLPDAAVRSGVLDVLPLATGSSPGHQPLHGVVLVDGLLDYLPDRPAAALLRAVRAWLAEGGRLVLTGLAPTEDDDLFHHVLEWPLVRRTAGQLVGLVERAGLCEVRCTARSGGLVVEARARS